MQVLFEKKKLRLDLKKYFSTFFPKNWNDRIRCEDRSEKIKIVNSNNKPHIKTKCDVIPQFACMSDEQLRDDEFVRSDRIAPACCLSSSSA